MGAGGGAGSCDCRAEPIGGEAFEQGRRGGQLAARMLTSSTPGRRETSLQDGESKGKGVPRPMLETATVTARSALGNNMVDGWLESSPVPDDSVGSAMWQGSRSFLGPSRFAQLSGGRSPAPASRPQTLAEPREAKKVLGPGCHGPVLDPNGEPERTRAKPQVLSPAEPEGRRTLVPLTLGDESLFRRASGKECSLSRRLGASWVTMWR